MASPNGHVVVEEDESGIDQSLDEIMKDPCLCTLTCSSSCFFVFVDSSFSHSHR